jgi:hypothetical protein
MVLVDQAELLAELVTQDQRVMPVIQAPMEQVGQAELQVRLEQRVQQELLVT